MSLKLELTCGYCSKIYSNPFSLPCNDTICQEHLIEANTIKCATCGEEFTVKDNEFIRPIKVIKSLIDKEMFLSENEKVLKKSIETSLNDFYNLYAEFMKFKSSLDLTCFNHFQEIRRKIDLQREELKQQIDKIALSMIEQTKKFESKYAKSLKENVENISNLFARNTLQIEQKNLNETFRDPTLTLDAIQKMHSLQLSKIKDLQTQMDEVKSNLKSNDFNAMLKLVDKNSFGSLNLNDQFNSFILDVDQSCELLKLCEFNTNDKWALLYRGSRDGFGAKDFHGKCDGKSSTLTIIKPKDSCNIFGGFISVACDSMSKWKLDPNAFIFSLVNKDGRPCKMTFHSVKKKHSLFFGADFGPVFGSEPNGCDILIKDSSNVNNNSSDLGSGFKHDEYMVGSKEAKSFLAGTYEFQVSEIEVYSKLDKQ